MSFREWSRGQGTRAGGVPWGWVALLVVLGLLALLPSVWFGVLGFCGYAWTDEFGFIKCAPAAPAGWEGEHE